jgi:hypothetical protein
VNGREYGHALPERAMPTGEVSKEEMDGKEVSIAGRRCYSLVSGPVDWAKPHEA